MAPCRLALLLIALCSAPVAHGALRHQKAGGKWRLFGKMANNTRSAQEVDWSERFVPLYPSGEVPGILESRGKMERYVKADSDNDPIGRRCCPGDNDGRWYYDVNVPALRPYLVEKSRTDRTDASAIVIPGGGCNFLAWTKEGVEIARWLNSFGVNAFVLKYRIPCNRQGHHMDGQRAVRLVRHHASALGLSPNRIGVIGFSQGGELATFLATRQEPWYRAIDEVDNLPFRPDFLMGIYAAFFGDHDATYRAGAAPVTYLAIADNDQCVSPESNIDFYNARLDIQRQRGREDVKTELHVFADGRHGYGMCNLYPEADYSVCKWPETARSFIEAEVIHAGKYPRKENVEALRARDRAHHSLAEE